MRISTSTTEVINVLHLLTITSRKAGVGAQLHGTVGRTCQLSGPL
jgi:hypothetical protein